MPCVYTSDVLTFSCLKVKCLNNSVNWIRASVYVCVGVWLGVYLYV